MLKNEEGQALPIVLVVLLLGVFFITPAIFYANSALIAQRKAKLALAEQYAAESANTYVTARLLDPTYAGNPTPYSATINGIPVTVSVSAVATTSVTEASASTTLAAILPANNELWAVANIPTTAAKDAAVAYDTTGAPSSVTVPFTTGTVTFYFHNNPTPPTGDVAIPSAELSNPWTNLTMNTTSPTSTTLYNYDKYNPDGITSRDTVVGRWVERKAEGTNCASKVLDGYRYRAIWRSPVLSSSPLTISGAIQFRWWWGTQDGTTQSSQNITWWLCKFDPSQSVSIPANNPASLFPPPGKITPSASMWTRPFDLLAVAGQTKLSTRVDRISDTSIIARSWQLSVN